MKDDVERLHEILGYKCCASAIVQLGLEIKGERNDQLVQAVSGLCRGLRSELICGALTGAACMINLFDIPVANTELIPELVKWFTDVYGKEYGGIDCADITRDGPGVSAQHCQEIIEATYLQAKSLLSLYGYDFDERP